MNIGLNAVYFNAVVSHGHMLHLEHFSSADGFSNRKQGTGFYLSCFLFLTVKWSQKIKTVNGLRRGHIFGEKHRYVFNPPNISSSF